MNKEMLKSFLLLALSILVISVCILIGLYKTKSIEFPKCEYIPGVTDCQKNSKKCYYTSEDTAGCFTIFQKGYWIKVTPRVVTFSSSTTTNIINTVKDKWYLFLLAFIAFLGFHIYVKKTGKFSRNSKAENLKIFFAIFGVSLIIILGICLYYNHYYTIRKTQVPFIPFDPIY